MSRGAPGPSVCGVGAAHVLRGPAPCTGSGTGGQASREWVRSQAGQSRGPRCWCSGESGFTSGKTSLSMGAIPWVRLRGVRSLGSMGSGPLGALLVWALCCLGDSPAPAGGRHHPISSGLVQETHQCCPSCWPLCCSPCRACQLAGLKLKAVWNIPEVFALVSVARCRLFCCWFGWGGIADVLGSV